MLRGKCARHGTRCPYQYRHEDRILLPQNNKVFSHCNSANLQVSKNIFCSLIFNLMKFKERMKGRKKEKEKNKEKNKEKTRKEQKEGEK